MAQVDLAIKLNGTLYEINNSMHRWTHEDVYIPPLTGYNIQSWYPHLSLTKSDTLRTWVVDVIDPARDTEFHMGAGSNITVWQGLGYGTYIKTNEQIIRELEANEDDDVYEIVL